MDLKFTGKVEAIILKYLVKSDRTIIKVHGILAMDSKGVIGYDNDLIFHNPRDLKFFAEKTRGHACLMGRKTFESIGKILPKRLTFILTNHPEIMEEKLKQYKLHEDTPSPIILNPQNYIHQMEEVIEEQNKRLLYVCGGVSIFKLMLPYIKNWLVTKYDVDVRNTKVLGRFIPVDYDEKKLVILDPRYFNTSWYLLERNKFEDIDYTVRCYDVAASRSYYNMFYEQSIE